MSIRYPTYNLTLNGIKKQKKVHLLVAECFIPNPDNKSIINHIDGNTHNYNADNLEWVTASENAKHARKNGLVVNNNQTLQRIDDDLIENEQWVDLIDYPNYSISNFGRIMNKTTSRLKKTPLDNNGYPHVSLWKEGCGKTFQVHRIEYASFHLDEELEGFVINHKDGNKTNNFLDNLEKITYQENNLHAEYVINTHKSSKSVSQIDDSGNILRTFPSIAEAQRCLKISNLSRAIKKNYKINGYYWRFN